ncbi:YfiR family protein [Desulfoplanes sp.]
MADANKVRATYLYNLIWFVDWDQHDLGPSQSPFNILVMGDAPMASDIKKLTRGESFLDHPLVVTDTPVLSLADYRIIHIPRDFDSRIGDILAQTKDSQTLITGNDMECLRQGGMVAFVRIESTLKIYVNLQAIERAHIRLSAKLLKIATHIAPLPEVRQ